MTDSIKCFFAYASSPKPVSDLIVKAIELMNSTAFGVKVLGWQKSKVVGKPIIDEVCKLIDEAHIFICDLTTNNENVLFELGYAIASGKRIWITLNPKHHDAAKRYEELRLLTTIGYASYKTEYELSNKFFICKPFDNLEEKIYDPENPKFGHAQNEPTDLLYLKSKNLTQESNQLTKELRKAAIRVILDDPQEIASQTLDWYLEHISQSVGVLAHFGESERDANYSIDGKYALVCGMAYAFKKPILMLAHSPHTTPIDYRELTKIHQSTKECIRYFNDWFSDITKEIRAPERDRALTKKFFDTVDSLKSIVSNLGDYTAENEEDTIAEYFVETTAYLQSYNATDYMLFVGRKGSGKTANLYMLANDLAADVRNHICIIKPFDYQFEKIFELFNLSNSYPGKGYLVQSLWKFLILSELAQSVYEKLQAQPSYVMLREVEENFIKFVNENSDVIGTDFSDRMENAIRRLCELEIFDGSQEQRQIVSEKLHDNLLGELRVYLGELLSNKNKVCVLIDNLDKGWRQRDDLAILSDFLYSVNHGLG